MKKSQSGFSLLVILCVGVVVLVLLAIGWRLSNIDTPTAQTTANSTKASATKLYTDSAKHFTFRYPSTWSIVYDNSQPLEGPPISHDWTTESHPLSVMTADSGQNNVSVEPGCTTVDAEGAVVDILQAMKNRKDRFHTQQNLTLNGAKVLYDKTDFKSDTEHYIDHRYGLERGKNCLTISYRQSYHSTANENKSGNFDDSVNMPSFKAIVYSVRFLN